MNSPYRATIAQTVKTVAASSTLAALLLAVLLPAASAWADNPVPLPHLRPSSAGGGAAGAGAAATAVARPNVAVPFNPSLPLSAEQQQALANIDAYLNSFSLLEGKFIQIAPNGNQSDGVFFINRPGKIRFHFNPPSQVDIIASNGKVAVRDQRVGTQDEYPLSKTPLRYLLADHIDLTSPHLVGSITEESDLISLVIAEAGSFASGQVTLIFDRKTYELRRWVVQDAQGLNTSVDIFNVTLGKAQDPNLFRIAVN